MSQDCAVRLRPYTFRMRRTSYEQMNCSIASALDVVGEPWTLLIVRDAFYGVRRFDDFQENLGIARNVPTARPPIASARCATNIASPRRALRCSR